MYFDAVVVKVKTFLLLFRLALAILWMVSENQAEIIRQNGVAQGTVCKR